jgi:tetratricopeptide (TPR) repeat protein
LTRALDNLACAYIARGDLARSRDLSHRSLALQERIQNPWGMSIALSNVGATYRLLGEWKRARRYLERGEELHRALAPSSWAVYLLVELSGLCLDEGMMDRATSLAEDALAIAQRSGHIEGMRRAQLVLAESDLFAGRPAAARARLEPLLDRSGLEEWSVAGILPTLAAACLAGGDQARAEQLINEAIRRATEAGDMLSLTQALIVQGGLLLEQGRVEQALRSLRESIRLSGGMPCPYLEARARYGLGLLHAKRGEKKLEREELQAALAAFCRLGAQPYVLRTEKALGLEADVP